MVSLQQADKLGYSLIKSDCGHPCCIRKGPADGINASRGQQRKRIHRALGPPDEAMMLRADCQCWNAELRLLPGRFWLQRCCWRSP